MSNETKSTLTDELKAEIDALSYEQLLRVWRFARWRCATSVRTHSGRSGRGIVPSRSEPSRRRRKREPHA